MSAPLKLCNKTNGGINAGTFHADHCRSSRSMPNQTGLDHQEHEASSASMPSYVEWHDSHQKEKFEEDPKLHVGRGNIMTYRWVARVVSEPNYGGTVLEATEALSTSTEAMGLRNIAHQEHFLLIVMPDLFMTLGYMERWLGGLLEKNSRGRLLLVRKTLTVYFAHFFGSFKLLKKYLDVFNFVVCGRGHLNIWCRRFLTLQR